MVLAEQAREWPQEGVDVLGTGSQGIVGRKRPLRAVVGKPEVPCPTDSPIHCRAEALPQKNCILLWEVHRHKRNLPLLKEKAAYATTSRDRFGGGTEEKKFFDCDMFPLHFQKKQHFPSKHKANSIVSLLRSTDLLTTPLLKQ